MVMSVSGSSVSRCNYFVHRKKRFCKMTVKFGEEYCGEHQKVCEDINNDVSGNKKTRIVCPLDKKHTCYAHMLKKHLKICNAGKVLTKPYIVKGINSRDESDSTDDCYKSLYMYSVEDIKVTISKVIEIFDRLSLDQIFNKFMKHVLIEDEMNSLENGEKAKKHLRQVSSILGLLNDYRLINSKTCYIEFGAGRGQLGYWIAKIIEDDIDSNVLLIDRSSPKHKKDNKISKSANKIQRIRADIADIKLDQINVIKEADHVVATTKHLCGEATDLALRCLNNIDNKSKLNGAVLTLCCHHRCRWPSYTGKEFFMENHLTKSDFDIMCGMASWATCGSSLNRNSGKDISHEINENIRNTDVGLSFKEKEEIGKKSKRILDWGRRFYLEKLNLKCTLLYYIDSKISLENVCIVAYK